MKTAILAFLLFALLPIAALAAQRQELPRGAGSVTVERVDPRTGGRIAVTLSAPHSDLEIGSGQAKLSADWTSSGIKMHCEATQEAHESNDQFVVRYHTLFVKMLAQFPVDPQ